jgi:CheY-like chemotaxis protein
VNTRTVLIADDEPSLRTLIVATLESDGYRVLEAQDGQEALRLLASERPALAIFDVSMPNYTGIQLTSLIRRTPALASMAVILLTSNAQAADIQAGVESGADLYMTKPFSPLELLTAVEQMLARVD